ncbi:MAG: hypothetical protein IR153_01170 [Flavobacterium sp.]|nr:hypothetical protein [Flavobacterium sp.]
MSKEHTTCPEEQLAFEIVKNILSQKVEENRISRSNAKTYLGVLLDNNSHRTICRLYLRNKKKYIGILSERKVETKEPIKCVEEIELFSKTLYKTLSKYQHLA